MARPIRVEFEGAAYHITSRGNDRRTIYRDDRDRETFLKTLGECAERFGLVVQAYCLMPNHYHLLASTPRGNLSRAVGWLQTTYSIRFNRRHAACGHLMQGRFKAQLIDADAYARRVVRYVHLNPVRPRDRRKVVPPDRRRFFDAYRWSSHRAYAGTATNAETREWLNTDWLSYWTEGAGQARQAARARRAYMADIAGCFGEPAASPFDDVRGGLVLGGEALWKKAKDLLRGKPREAERRFVGREDGESVRKRVEKLIEDEPDGRVKIWARMRLGGESLTDLARELGYSDASGVHRVAQRLEVAAKEDRELRRRLEELKDGVLSKVKH